MFIAIVRAHARGRRNDGLIDYYRKSCASSKTARRTPVPRRLLSRLLKRSRLVAPEGCSVIFDRSGRRHLPDGDRLVRVAQEDVDALERIGFTKLKLEVCS